MAYVPDNLTGPIFASIGGVIPRFFVYNAVADADATIVGAGYFANGVTSGMRVGDMVYVVATTGPKYKEYQVLSVSGQAATVQAAAAIT